LGSDGGGHVVSRNHVAGIGDYYVAVIFNDDQRFQSGIPAGRFSRDARIVRDESCVTKMYLGFDCPGCGMTRAFIRISSGQFAKALQLNSASFVVYLFFAIQIPWHAMQLFRIGKGIGPVDSWLTIVPALAMVVTLVVCWIWRV